MRGAPNNGRNLFAVSGIWIISGPTRRMATGGKGGDWAVGREGGGQAVGGKIGSRFQRYLAHKKQPPP